MVLAGSRQVGYYACLGTGQETASDKCNSLLVSVYKDFTEKNKYPLSFITFEPLSCFLANGR